MPSTRNASTRSTIATTSSNKQQKTFAFPHQRHLLITTPRNVFTWDSNGVHTVFRSRRGGITAAREAKDGSGVLAVASNNVVVMHDTKRGKEESWGLNAPQDNVRHLEYTPDAKSLFLSTTTEGTIQHYNTESSRLVDPALKHESTPVALAISPTGHLILSASQNPPVVYLKNLAHNTAPLHIQPSASTAAVSVAAFHPERQNVFLLAFRDGTVAGYDATKTAKKGIYANQATVSDGEISHLTNLHRVVASSDESLAMSTSIVGAAFLPGFKTRAVTAGSDGKCKIIDFASGGVVIRTWHSRAPVTSVTAIPRKSTQGHVRPGSGSRRTQTSAHTIGGPTSTDSLIAVGRIDGKVQIYDSVGLLLTEKTISSMEEKILSLEWGKGGSPVTRSPDLQRRFSEDEEVILKHDDQMRASTAEVRDPLLAALSHIREPGSHPPLGLTDSAVARQSADDHNEEEVNTVRYTPSSNRRFGAPVAGGEYHDLFSPVKLEEAKARSALKSPISSPPRNRPRLSSQTFMRNEDSQVIQPAKGCPPRATESHATSSSSPRTQSRQVTKKTLQPPRRASVVVSPVGKSRRHIMFAHAAADGSVSSRIRTVASGASARPNAKVLADLRRLVKDDPSLRKYGTLSSYAASQTLRASPRARQTESEISMVHSSRNGPVAPAKLSVDSCDDIEDDIWFTSDTDETHQERRQPPNRPPARQTSRSRLNSDDNDTIGASLQPTSQITLRRHVDGSTEDDAFSTARSNLSPTGAFSPRSEQVRELFPRSSSLSPAKTRGIRETARPLPTGKENSSRKLAATPKSPWARMQASKHAHAVRVYADTDKTNVSRALPRSEEMVCLTCPETRAKVQGLETELAQLKGEVIALKAILRRNGLPFPACLRNR